VESKPGCPGHSQNYCATPADVLINLVSVFPMTNSLARLQPERFEGAWRRRRKDGNNKWWQSFWSWQDRSWNSLAEIQQNHESQ